MSSPSAEQVDVVCIGRAAVDLYGEQVGVRLEDVQTFARYLGGSPGNSAFGCARLGLRSAMVTRVGDEHNGRFVRETLAQAGVDVSQVRTDPARLTALVFLAIRDRDTFPLLFYRDNCADMALDAEDIDAAFIARAKAVLVSGTHFSTPRVHAASVKAMRAARAAGARVVLDIDYRPVLWGLTKLDAGEARFIADDGVSRHLQGVIGLVDLLVGTEEEINIAGGTDDPLESLRVLRAHTEAIIVMKRGAHGCVIFTGEIPERIEEGIVVAGFPVEVFNVLGAGDAFMAGFLRGWLREEPLVRCAEFANACGAIVVSRHGCAPAMPTWPELHQFLVTSRGVPGTRRLRENQSFEHLHHATTRIGQWSDMAVFGFDHRTFFEELARESGAPHARIARFKRLALGAALAADPAHCGQKGLLLDDDFGDELLPQLADAGVWLGRPVERPASLPLRWQAGADLGSVLRGWPRHHVAKCVVYSHPSQSLALRIEQIERLQALQSACRASAREWLLMVLPPPEIAPEAADTAGCMDAFYEVGLQPDWWALRHEADGAEWQRRLGVLARRDPLARGVLVALPDRSPAELRQIVRVLPRALRGFIAGRAIFRDSARDWMHGRVDDTAALRAMRERYTALMQVWAERAR